MVVWIVATHELFRQLGLFTLPGFLGPKECERWRRVADRSKGHAGLVYREGARHEDEEVRKTLQVDLGWRAKRKLEKRLKALRPDLERHFKRELAKLDEIACLVYRPGDFFKLHRDAQPAESGEFKFIERRQITLVAFLNDPNHSSEPYQGGELGLHGLMDIPDSESFGFPLEAETGLLVAFPSNLLHVVSPITEGKRYTLVSWFH